MTKVSTRAVLGALCGTCAVVAAFAPITTISEYNIGATNIGHGDSLRRNIPLHATNDDDVPDKKKDQKEDKFRYSEMAFDKAVRVAKAQEKIDRILKNPDAPFDRKAEMKKVVDTFEGLTPEEQRIDDTVTEIEADIYAAVDRQDFETAASKKKELGKVHVDDCGAVLQINSAFYKAFSENDYELMDEIWLKDQSVLCFHPASPALVGNKNVMESWKELFGQNQAMHRTWVEPSEVRLVVRGATAIVTCDEDFHARQFIRGKARETELINKLTSTNIFRKVSGKWYMVHHHASWHKDSKFAKRAMADPGSQSPAAAAPSPGGLPGAKSRVIRLGGDSSPLGGDLSRLGGDSDDNEAGLLDGTLGKAGLGPLLGGSSSDGKGTPQKRIITGGSLSDFLSGGLGDILGGAGGMDDAAGGEDNIGKIIRFRIERDGEDDGMDDDDDDDDIGEALSMINKWADAQSGARTSSTSSKLTKTSAPKNSGSAAPKDALRQNCISAIRKLCEQGSLSPAHKRLLLTDIISCSAKGEFSQVEVAYELLCGENEYDDTANEEFADQCLVHVQTLMDNQ